jgi:hypothetical protein
MSGLIKLDWKQWARLGQHLPPGNIYRWLNTAGAKGRYGIRSLACSYPYNYFRRNLCVLLHFIMVVFIFPYLYTAITVLYLWDINVYTQMLDVIIFLSTCFGLIYPSSGNIYLESYACYCQISYAPDLLIKLIVKIETGIKMSRDLHVGIIMWCQSTFRK